MSIAANRSGAGATTGRDTPDGDTPGDDSVPLGLFGENFSTTGMSEKTVCIGDLYRVGEALLEVAGPRQPCGKLGYRVGDPEVAERMQEEGSTGWYYRVIEPGLIEAGQTLDLVERPRPEWTVASIILGLYGTPLDEDPLER